MPRPDGWTTGRKCPHCGDDDCESDGSGCWCDECGWEWTEPTRWTEKFGYVTPRYVGVKH